MATTHIKTKNIYDKEVDFTIDSYLFNILKEMKIRADNKLDNVIIITGKVGSGKSNIGDGIAGVWQRLFFKKDYTLDMVHFSADSVVKATDREDNINDVIKYDEAIIGGSGRAVMSAEGQRLKEALITKRRKGHLWIFITDEIKELNQKIVTRCNLLIDVNYYKDKRQKNYYRKGKYKIFSHKEAVKIYDLMKDKSIRTIDEYRYSGFKPNYSCMNYADIFFSEDEYDKKKVIETKQLSQKVGGDKDQRNKLIRYLNKELKVSQQTIANEIGLTRQTINQICKEELA